MLKVLITAALGSVNTSLLFALVPAAWCYYSILYSACVRQSDVIVSASRFLLKSG
jgi:hypothetical protein